MRKPRLFAKVFAATVAAVLAAVLLMSAAMLTALQRTRQEAFESEVTAACRELASLMEERSQIFDVRYDATFSSMISRRLSEVQEAYQADIWLASWASGGINVSVLDASLNTRTMVQTDVALEQLSKVMAGEEIRAAGLFPELSEQMVTIGVPWRYRGETIVGAVLLHIEPEALAVPVSDVLPPVLLAAGAALLLGALLSFAVARGQSRPIRRMETAVSDFARGDFQKKIEPQGSAELQSLALSINRMAEELSRLEESRRSFVANVSHELRSPLTCVLGYVESMQDGAIPVEEYPKYLQIVRDETQRLTGLVSELLTLSRIESGKLPLERTEVRLGELACRILVTYEARIEQKQIEIETDLRDEGIPVSADEARVSQVLRNLIDNAVKFTEDGGKIALRTAEEGDSVRFAIANTGSISEEDLPQVFDRFFTADRARTSGSGTGLGLAIAQKIAQEHGSLITVSSEGGETRFEFLLAKWKKTE